MGTACPAGEREVLVSLLSWGSHDHSAICGRQGSTGVPQRTDTEATNYVILSLFISTPTAMGQGLIPFNKLALLLASPLTSLPCTVLTILPRAEI